MNVRAYLLEGCLAGGCAAERWFRVAAHGFIAMSAGGRSWTEPRWFGLGVVPAPSVDQQAATGVISAQMSA
jgi:hypothetical protein